MVDTIVFVLAIQALHFTTEKAPMAGSAKILSVATGISYMTERRNGNEQIYAYIFLFRL